MIEYLIDGCGLSNAAVITGAALAVAVLMFVEVVEWVIIKLFDE